MDELLLNFLGREREKTVRIGERTCATRADTMADFYFTEKGAGG